MKIEDIELKHGKTFHKGEYYEIEMVRGKPTFKKVTDEVEKQLGLADEITNKIYKRVDTKKILTEALMRLRPDEVEKLYMLIFKGKKQYKIKTREHHCCDVKVGNFVLPVVP